MKVDEWLAKHTEGIPGLAYVATVLTLLAAALALVPEPLLPEGREGWRTAGVTALSVLLVWVIAWVLYRLGALLDRFLFDPLYSVPDRNQPVWERAWWRLLRPLRAWIERPKRGSEESLKELRLRTLRRLAPPTVLERFALRRDADDVTGLYASAMTLYEGGAPAKLLFSDRAQAQQEKLVKPALELSKAARAFVLPLTGLLVYDLVLVVGVPALPSWLTWLGWSRTSLTALPDWLPLLLVPLIGAGAAAFLFVRLRLVHMTAVYRVVADLPVTYWTITDAVGEGRPQPMLSVGKVLLPARALALFAADAGQAGPAAPPPEAQDRIGQLMDKLDALDGTLRGDLEAIRTRLDQQQAAREAAHQQELQRLHEALAKAQELAQPWWKWKM